MKRKQNILNLAMMILVLFAILFQSFHSYKHLTKELSQEICHHKYNLHKTQFTHHHNTLEHCFVCEFTFSSFIRTEISHFEFKNLIVPTGYSIFKSREITQFFKGSLFALRAPPIFIV